MTVSTWQHWLGEGALFALVAVVLVLVVVTLRNGLLSLGLYMDREEGEATVEGAYRRFGLLPRVRYAFWTPGGIVRGTAPASCARAGRVRVAWRPLHPHWHRARDLMFDDVLLAGSLWVAAPVILALRVAAALRGARPA